MYVYTGKPNFGQNFSHPWKRWSNERSLHTKFGVARKAYHKSWREVHGRCITAKCSVSDLPQPEKTILYVEDPNCVLMSPDQI